MIHRHRRRHRFALFLLVAAQSAFGADWANWRGPARNGISEEKGLLKQWPQQGPKLLWRVEGMGDGYGAASVAGGRVYLMGNRGAEEEFVQALSVETGAKLWSTTIGKVGNPDQSPAYPASRSTPVLDGGLLYAFTSDGDLACLEPATGKVRWKTSVRSAFGGAPHKWAYAESPLLDGDAVVVSPGGPTATMLALHKKTGAVLWKSAIPGGEAPGYSSAIVVSAAGRKQYVQFLSGGVVGVDAATGKFLWRYNETSKGPANIPTPVAHGEYVYSTARSIGAGALIRLKQEGPDAVSADQVYFERGLPSTIGGSVLVDGTLYGTVSDGLVAADFLTGKVRWKNESVGMASVLYADGHLYVNGEDGEVALVEASPDAYKEKGRFSPPGRPAHPRGAREKGWAYPAVSAGRLYIRDLGVLWCYDVRQ